MKITILNGNMNPEPNDFSDYLEKLTKTLSKTSEVDCYNLSQMNLHYCTGCWRCWWKTPGKCTINDDAEPIFRSIINSDFLLFASPLMAGFTSSTLKKITDRLVGLLHPYIELRNGEYHHIKRYEKYPDFGLLLQKEPVTDEEDIRIVSDIYDRFAINFHSRKRFIRFIEENQTEEIVYETCHI
jgi:hypothetical protein